MSVKLLFLLICLLVIPLLTRQLDEGKEGTSNEDTYEDSRDADQYSEDDESSEESVEPPKEGLKPIINEDTGKVAFKDCVDGEVWYEKCVTCTCLANGTYSCVEDPSSCAYSTCIETVVYFKQDVRCHCNENGAAICVSLKFQRGLNRKPCSTDFYYYDSCTFCRCNAVGKKMICNRIENCNSLNGGTCRDDEIVIQDCFSCYCTFTKFRKCVPIPDCHSRKAKPGGCVKFQSLYSERFQFYCMSLINQECYTDYGCPDNKKCCHVVDCFNRCMVPMFEHRMFGQLLIH